MRELLKFLTLRRLERPSLRRRGTPVWNSCAAIVVAVAAVIGGSIANAVPAQAAGPTPAFKNEVLTAHNKVRAQYGAPPLTWSDALYPGTLQWASTYKFQHSNSGGKYGENLYFYNGLDTAGAIKKALASWMAESSKDNYNNPVFSGATGHFTQVAWKSTKQVTAAAVNCRKGTISGTSATVYVVARYSPAGNFQGQFEQNVGRPV
ncbi:CAP family protein [Nocardia sp. NPDC050408]|uniref:CAP family protein n=1 Tax=Nocardia sp. NPDC050408 TaxID=3364319 RepID=UPI003798CEC0